MGNNPTPTPTPTPTASSVNTSNGKNFTQFDLKTSVQAGDLLVGYKNAESSEFKLTLSGLADALRPHIQFGGSTPTPTPTP
jgi:hypothetical protein